METDRVVLADAVPRLARLHRSSGSRVLDSALALFAVATRSMRGIAIALISMLVVYSIAVSVGSRTQFRETAALFDPFGMQALIEITRCWSNQAQLGGLAGLLLYNRYHLACGNRCALVVTYSVRQPMGRRKRPPQSGRQAAIRLSAAGVQNSARRGSRWRNPIRVRVCSGPVRARAGIQQARHPPQLALLVLLVLALINLKADLAVAGTFANVPAYPVTGLMLDTLKGSNT